MIITFKIFNFNFSNYSYFHRLLVDGKYEATGALGENKKRKLKFDKLTLGGLDENNGGMIGCIEEVKINQILIQDLLHYNKLRITKKQEVLDQ